MTFQVMIIEDNHSDARLIEEAFGEVEANCRITVESDGEAALKTLHGGFRPHLIFLDLNLAGMSGLEIMEEVRNSDDDVLKVTPVILLTNSKSESDVHEAYKAGCNAFMTKPLGYDRIMEAIESASKFWFMHATLPSRIPPPTYPPESDSVK